MLGQGVNQKIIDATIACTTSSVGVDIASDKEATKRILAKDFIPVPEGKAIYDKEELKNAIYTIRFSCCNKTFEW